MPAYNPKVVEPKWQKYWLEHKTFRTPDFADKPKYYILDMFPYPSGAGLHVGHPEGYTATDILARYQRMCGFNVLHPMGWDAFGLPAEEHARQTGEHPSSRTKKNIAEFRRQIQMLGFSYDWDREVDTTDPKYFKWTQWIFLQLFDTWYDAGQKRGRPIAELPIPPEIQAQGPDAVRTYQDGKRLAYQAEVPVNWCAALGTVLANEEVVDGKSERGGHPVVRMPLRQWLLRITAYAERLLDDLDRVDWPESIKLMQRDWIGKSEGAEVDFLLAPATVIIEKPKESVPDDYGPIRVFTTRPDTLFGATYMVLAPEHPLVKILTTPLQKHAVDVYRAEAARKSERERTENKKKSGVFTGAFAINPVNREKIPIWIADYVLSTYGTGAIMAVPGHDERDFEFARQYRLPIRPVVLPPRAWLEKTSVHKVVVKIHGGSDPRFSPSNVQQPDQRAATLSQPEYTILAKASKIWKQGGTTPIQVTEYLFRQNVELFEECFVDEGTAINSGPFDDLPTLEFKQKITAWLEERGQGQKKVNFKLRDWLFSRQRYWGEPFPILHELDASGKPTGRVEALTIDDLPLELPDLEDFKPTGNPEPPLSKARAWLEVTRSGKKYRRETNTMPQWAGSCWYYLRYVDPANTGSFCDPGKEKHWLPVDLYVGGAEHAVLHLLYARFWHKVLHDRGHVHTPEPFQRLVNQGMILGEMQYHVRPDVFRTNQKKLQDMKIGGIEVKDDEEVIIVLMNQMDDKLVSLGEEQVEKRKGLTFLAGTDIELSGRADKMSKSRGNVVNPDEVVEGFGADSLRLFEMFMGPLEATKPWSMKGVKGVYNFLSRVWRLAIDEHSEAVKLSSRVQDVPADRDTQRMLHKTVKKVSDDLENMAFNTAISSMMELTNHLMRQDVCPRAVLETLTLLLSPFAPHLAEELWQALGHASTLAYEPWPRYDATFLKVDEIEVPVQINGKVRGKVIVPAEIDAASLEKTALNDEHIKRLLEGKSVRKVVVVPGKLVNVVVG